MRYKDDGHVLFELYNEPNNIGLDVWLHGGTTLGFKAVGMQELYDAVRAAGANNVVIAGGTNWAYDLSGVGPGGVAIQGYNVMYATHPCTCARATPRSGWEAACSDTWSSRGLRGPWWRPSSATPGRRRGGTGAYDSALIQFANQHHMSFTAWAWYVDDGDLSADPQGCSFPSLILDWTGTPTVQGAAVKRGPRGVPSAPWLVPSRPPGRTRETKDTTADAASVGDVPDAGADDATAE